MTALPSSHRFIEAYNPKAFYVVNLSLDADQHVDQTTVRWIGYEGEWTNVGDWITIETWRRWGGYLQRQHPCSKTIRSRTSSGEWMPPLAI